MDKRLSDKQISDKVSFISFIIPKFVDEYKMGIPQAYLYLKQYGGLPFLFKHWWALHTENSFWAVRYLYDVCYKNGGER
jgi:hypothetical protein